MTTITVKEPRVEELKEQIDNKLKDKNVNIDELKELLADAARYKEELNELYTKKMEWNSSQRNDVQFTNKEIADAYLLAKVKGVDYYDTPLGARMKAVVSAAAFQTGFTSQVQKELDMNLEVANVFRQVPVNQKTLSYPVMASSTAYASVTPAGKWPTNPEDGGNTAPFYQQSISEVQLTPVKFSDWTFLNRDEQAEAVFDLLTPQREDAVRKLARTIDMSVLRGDGTITTFTSVPTSYQAPFKGFAQLAYEVGGLGLTTKTGGVSNTATATTIASARSQMGKYGLRPKDLVYFTSVDGYHALVQDSYVVTVDKIGPHATILDGQVASLWGIPIKTTEYLSDVGTANNLVGALVYRPGFVIGKNKDISVRTDFDAKRNIDNIYIDARMDFSALTTESSAALSNSWSMASAVISAV